jgi:hypothetical protein
MHSFMEVDEHRKCINDNADGAEFVMLVHAN